MLALRRRRASVVDGRRSSLDRRRSGQSGGKKMSTALIMIQGNMPMGKSSHVSTWNTAAVA